jgi:hypothetical protein
MAEMTPDPRELLIALDAVEDAGMPEQAEALRTLVYRHAAATHLPQHHDELAVFGVGWLADAVGRWLVQSADRHPPGITVECPRISRTTFQLILYLPDGGGGMAFTVHREDAGRIPEILDGILAQLLAMPAAREGA